MSKSKVFISNTASKSSEWLNDFNRSLAPSVDSVSVEEQSLTQGGSVGILEKKLRDSDVIVIFLDTESSMTPEVYLKLGFALAAKKDLIAIVPHNVDLSTLPRPVRSRAIHQLSSPEKSAHAVATRIGGHTEGEGVEKDINQTQRNFHQLYEVVFIIDPRLEKVEMDFLLTKLCDVVKSKGGEVLRTEHMGLRNLAYRIGENTDGYFVLLEVGGTRTEIAELERQMRASGEILRYLTVLVDEDRRRAEKIKYRRVPREGNKSLKAPRAEALAAAVQASGGNSKDK